MSEPRSYTTYNALTIYRRWKNRSRHRQLAAARYWLQYGIGEDGCDHACLRAWLERWWSRVPVAEQRMLDNWMKSVHRSLEESAKHYVVAQRKREKRWMQLITDENIDPIGSDIECDAETAWE